MTSRLICASAILTILLAATSPALGDGDEALSTKHVALAEEAAGADLTRALGNCKNIGKSFVIPADKIDPLLVKVIGLGEPKPVRVFDNMVFLGTKWVTAWAIVTSEGIILFDALNNKDEVATFIEGGLTAAGLDPADIKKIVIAHAHGDHYGGARYLQEKYGAEVIMSGIDWDELEKSPLQYASKHWDAPPKRDVSVGDGDEVTLGDTTVRILLTPGHTPGTIGALVPLKNGEAEHRAVIWGGQGLNWGPIGDRFVSMMNSARRIGDMAEPEGIDVFLSNHSGIDGVYELADELAAREAGASDHPLVIGHDDVRRFTDALYHCVAAQLASFAPDMVPAD